MSVGKKKKVQYDDDEPHNDNQKKMKEKTKKGIDVVNGVDVEHSAGTKEMAMAKL